MASQIEPIAVKRKVQDYPFAAINLMTRLSELTRTRVSRDPQHQVNYWVVRLTDPTLFDCPVLLGTDVGTASFSDEEAKRLREYLLKGGFLWVDDFWGTESMEQWTGEMHRFCHPLILVPGPLLGAEWSRHYFCVIATS